MHGWPLRHRDQEWTGGRQHGRGYGHPKRQKRPATRCLSADTMREVDHGRAARPWPLLLTRSTAGEARRCSKQGSTCAVPRTVNARYSSRTPSARHWQANRDHSVPQSRHRATRRRQNNAAADSSVRTICELKVKDGIVYAG